MPTKQESKIVNGQLLIVEYGLEKIGDQKPYFTVTGELYHGRVKTREPETCGCIHEEILKAFPGMADIIALHLSDIDGIPMHAAANGYYWLAGTIQGGLGQEYHGGNGSNGRTPVECFNTLKEHLRISDDETRTIRDDVLKAIATTPGIKEGLAAGKSRFGEFVESLKPRWKSEAETVISKYHLKV